MNQKRKKLEQFILPLLKCIVCDKDRLKLNENGLRCEKCDTVYPVHNDIPIMLTDPERAFAYAPNVVVENSYNPQWLDIINKANGEPVLDLGSGNNPDSYSNLIKLEIFALPNVDVVSYGEHLPFIDNSFQTVFSGAVIEHVQDPAEVINNIYSILQQNGDVHIETAFLQPVHAYPNHFYNMTKSGLENLCSGFTHVDSGVKGHQSPAFTLHWILNSWQSKLEGEEKESFLDAKVSDIIDAYGNDPFSRKWFSAFSDTDIEELACGVYFHGTKPLLPRVPLWKKWAKHIRDSIRFILGKKVILPR